MSSQRAEKSGLSGSVLVVGILAANLMLHNMQRSAPVPLFEELRTAWGCGYAGMGSVFGAFLMAYAVCLLPMGILADRVDNKRLLITGFSLSMVSSVVFALAPSLEVAIIARLALGVSSSMIYVPTVRYVVATFGAEKRGSVMGWVELGAGLGSMMALTILPVADPLLGLIGTFLIPTSIAAVLLIGIVLGLKSTRSTGKSLSKAGGIFRYPTFWAFVIFNFLGLYSTYSLSGWLPTYLRRQLGSTATEAGTVTALSSLGLMIFSPIGGAISDRIGARKPVMLAGSLISVVCLTMLILTGDVRVIMVAALLKGIGSALTTPVGIMFAGEVFADAGAGFAVGLTVTTGQIASSVSGPVTGYILDSTGSFLVIWGVALAFSLARIPLLMSIGERRARERAKQRAQEHT